MMAASLAVLLIAGCTSTQEKETPISTIEFKKDIGGWTFSASLDDRFRLTDNPVTEKMNYDVPDKFWRGFMIDTPAYYPAYPNAPKGNENYAKSAGGIDAIYVVKLPQERLDEKLQHNIGVYGSADKIPADRIEEDMKELLKGAGFNLGHLSDSEEYLDFGGRMAYISKRDLIDDENAGTLVVLLDNVTNTIGVIAVSFDTKPLPDGQVFEQKPWDIIKEFRIERSK